MIFGPGEKKYRYCKVLTLYHCYSNLALIGFTLDFLASSMLLDFTEMQLVFPYFCLLSTIMVLNLLASRMLLDSTEVQLVLPDFSLLSTIMILISESNSILLSSL